MIILFVKGVCHGSKVCKFCFTCKVLSQVSFTCNHFTSFFYQSQSCIYVKDLMEDIPDDVDLQNSPGKLSIVLK